MSLVAGTVGLLTSAAACAAAVMVLRRFGVVDVPNSRSSHGRPTVRGVGVGVACGGVAGLIGARWLAGGPAWPWRAMSVLVLVALGVAAIGLVDDLRGGIPFQVRLGAQAVGAVIAVAALGAGTLALPWAALLTVGGVIGIIGYVNAFNFMDGINGISGASAAVAGVMFAVIGRLETLPVIEAGGMALAAACLGFLPFNIPTARAFLGDVGSYFIGAWIAVLAYLAARAGVRLDVILAPLALYLADVGCTLAARVLRGDQWHAAHRDHTYQRLTASCDGHMRTTLFVLVVNTSLAGLGLVSLRAPGWRPLAWLGMALLLGVYLLSPSLIRRNRRPEPVVGPFGGAAQPSDPAPRGPL